MPSCELPLEGWMFLAAILALSNCWDELGAKYIVPESWMVRQDPQNSKEHGPSLFENVET